jgi:hypothetical protein
MTIINQKNNDSKDRAVIPRRKETTAKRKGKWISVLCLEIRKCNAGTAVLNHY